MCTGTPRTGVKKHSEWVSQIPRKRWIKRDSFVLFTAVFLHPYFIDPCYEKRQIIFPGLLQSILQTRKAQLHISDHQETLSVHKRRLFFTSCNQLLQNSASIRSLPKGYLHERSRVKLWALQNIRQPHTEVWCFPFLFREEKWVRHTWLWFAFGSQTCTI